MSVCRCGHDRILHHECTGPCLIMTASHPYWLCIGCGCAQFDKTPATPKTVP